MADKDYKAFIVEGEAREPQIIDNISKVFFKHGNFKIGSAIRCLALCLEKNSSQW